MKRLRKEKWGYLFLLPWFCFFIIFTVYPFLYGFKVSFYDYTISRLVFVGVSNYVQAFGSAPFWRSVCATFEYAVIILPVTVLVSLWISKVLSTRGKKINAFAKAVFYLPSVTNQVALVIVWNFLFSPAFGLVASIFRILKLDPISWFDSPVTAIPLLALLICTYGLGQPVILYTAAINGIPDCYFEAARIDGATENQIFFLNYAEAFAWYNNIYIDNEYNWYATNLCSPLSDDKWWSKFQNFNITYAGIYKCFSEWKLWLRFSNRCCAFLYYCSHCIYSVSYDETRCD